MLKRLFLLLLCAAAGTALIAPRLLKSKRLPDGFSKKIESALPANVREALPVIQETLSAVTPEGREELQKKIYRRQNEMKGEFEQVGIELAEEKPLSEFQDSAEEKELYKEIRGDMKTKKNPFLEKLLEPKKGSMEAPGPKAIMANLKTQILPQYGKWQPKVKLWMWLIAGVFMVMVFFTLLLPARDWMSLPAGVGYGLAKLWLWMISMTSVSYFLALRDNPWTAIPAELIFAPALILLLSALLLRSADKNVSFAKKALSGLMPLFAAFVLTAALRKYL
ncbi:MAG: hypothetical protein HY611_09415 [Elusimicrobia bacterium]|nr:hypothetical protein [Elusimicrobiota bacterium]